MMAIALMIAACTSESADYTTTTPVEPTLPATVEADWLVHTEGPPGTWLDALLVGELHIDVDTRCVTVTSSGHRLVIVFIDGAVLDITDPAEPVLIRHTGARYEDGDTVEWGGGSWGESPDFADNAGPAYRNVSIPESCVYDGVWVIAPEY